MNKPRVAIVTITDGCNYGNRLQNYALQRALEKCGAEVETLKRKNYHDAFAVKIKNQCKLIVKSILRRDMDAPKRSRKRSFRIFNSKFIHFSRYTLQKNKAPRNLKSQYDAFFVGSDQVWNPSFRLVREDIDNYFASFAPKEKKFSYAASFGVSEIPVQYTDYYREKLRTFKKISVREDQGVAIVADLSGEIAQSVCDPTLLLNSEEWANLMAKPIWMDEEKYLVTYFLGEISDEIKNEIDKYAKKNGLKVVPFQSEFIRSQDILNCSSFAAPPQEFLWLIAHSKCVLTDSFHACVFSILYKRPFQVFNRKAVEENNKMESRLETLLTKFSLRDRMGKTNIREDLLTEELNDCDIEQVLIQERIKGYGFIEESLLLL